MKDKCDWMESEWSHRTEALDWLKSIQYKNIELISSLTYFSFFVLFSSVFVAHSFQFGFDFAVYHFIAFLFPSRYFFFLWKIKCIRFFSSMVFRLPVSFCTLHTLSRTVRCWFFLLLCFIYSIYRPSTQHIIRIGFYRKRSPSTGLSVLVPAIHIAHQWSLSEWSHWRWIYISFKTFVPCNSCTRFILGCSACKRMNK